nr:MAG TPA: hypothetical protein [Caudoviricetes sp.]
MDAYCCRWFCRAVVRLCRLHGPHQFTPALTNKNKPTSFSSF